MGGTNGLNGYAGGRGGVRGGEDVYGGILRKKRYVSRCSQGQEARERRTLGAGGGACELRAGGGGLARGEARELGGGDDDPAEAVSLVERTSQQSERKTHFLPPNPTERWARLMKENRFE